MVNLVERWQLIFFEVWSKSSPAGTSENVIKFNVQKDDDEEDTSSPFCIWNMFRSTKDSNRPFINSHDGKIFTFVEPVDSNLSTDTRLRQSVG